MRSTVSFFALGSFIALLGACSPNAEMVASKRPAEFFGRFLNPAADFATAESKLGELKVMEVGEEYPMRYVLFQDGRFYYQIDRLGDGTGWWKMEGGGLELTAVRPIFDMHLYLSAAADSGDATVLRFNDRHGFNSVDIRLRDPRAADADSFGTAAKVFGLAPTRLPELRPFTAHPSGI